MDRALPVECASSDEHLVALVYDERDAVPEAVLRHVEGCDRCTQELVSLERTRELAAISLETPSAGLDARVLEVFDREEGSRGALARPAPRRSRRAWRTSFAMAASVAVVGGGVWLASSGEKNALARKAGETVLEERAPARASDAFVDATVEQAVAHDEAPPPEEAEHAALESKPPPVPMAPAVRALARERNDASAGSSPNASHRSKASKAKVASEETTQGPLQHAKKLKQDALTQEPLQQPQKPKQDAPPQKLERQAEVARPPMPVPMPAPLARSALRALAEPLPEALADDAGAEAEVARGQAVKEHELAVDAFAAPQAAFARGDYALALRLYAAVAAQAHDESVRSRARAGEAKSLLRVGRIDEAASLAEAGDGERHWQEIREEIDARRRRDTSPVAPALRRVSE